MSLIDDLNKLKRDAKEAREAPASPTETPFERTEREETETLNRLFDAMSPEEQAETLRIYEELDSGVSSGPTMYRPQFDFNISRKQK